MNYYKIREKELLIAFGLRLRKYRLAQNYSQESLAELSGLHRTYIGSAERGERNVSLLNIFKIADALNIEPSKLLNDE